MESQKPNEVIQEMILSQGYFPGNVHYPLLIYKQVFLGLSQSPQAIKKGLKKNDWLNAWVDSIYDFHHYHSNTHEVLVILSGVCQVQFGGDYGSIYTINQGDVILIPAGVTHKSLSLSDDFQCLGAYPFDVGYDMNYGEASEYIQALEKIKHVGLPKRDPIFGDQGLLFDYWK